MVTLVNATELPGKGGRFSNVNQHKNDKMVMQHLNSPDHLRPWQNTSAQANYQSFAFENFTSTQTNLLLNTFKPDVRFTFNPETSINIDGMGSYFNFFPSYEKVIQLNFKLFNQQGSTVKINVSKSDGRIVFANHLSIEKDIQLITIPLDEILTESGSYDFSIQLNDTWEGFRFNYAENMATVK